MKTNYVILKKSDSAFFKDYVENLKEEIGEQKVLIYGAGLAFEKLEKDFGFKSLNVVAISDIKFTEEGEFCGFKSIPPGSISNQEFDVVLMTLYYPQKAVLALINSNQITKDTEIKYIFEEIIAQEHSSLAYLEEIKFEKHLKKLSKKLKNKKVVIYGTGIFFEAIKAYYDLCGLNIIAVSDRKYENHPKGEEFLGYPVCSPGEIKDLNPDYVLVATRFFINIILHLESTFTENKKIKIQPLIKKPFFELVKELWD